ncbi:hypothetical protein [Microbacterium sp. NPDC055357]
MTITTPPAAEPRTSYEFEFAHQMDDIDALIDTETNPARRRILINYRRHGMLEVSGRYDELLAENMTVRHPKYRIFEGGAGVILDGMQQVRDFYAMLADMDMLVMWTGRQKMAVAEWGFAGEAEFSQFVPGKLLGDNVFASAGDESAASSEYDPDGWYLVRRTLAFAWMYDENQLMIGEHVYEDTESKVVTQVSADEVITAARAAELLAGIIDKYPLGG